MGIRSGGSPLNKLQLQNDAGENVDLYIPRKCSASNRIIYAKDHASIQMNIADVDEKTAWLCPHPKPMPSVAQSAAWVNLMTALTGWRKRMVFSQRTFKSFAG